jgi:hypothetical protein
VLKNLKFGIVTELIPTVSYKIYSPFKIFTIMFLESLKGFSINSEEGYYFPPFFAAFPAPPP